MACRLRYGLAMNATLAAALLASLLALMPPAHAAKNPAEKLADAMTELDQLVKERDIALLTPSLVPILKAEAAPLTKILVEDGMPFGSVALAQMLAEKTQQPLTDVLQKTADSDWIRLLEVSQVSPDEAIGYLEEIHTNVAFAMMDVPKKKAKRR